MSSAQDFKPSSSLKIFLAQINNAVGDIEGNCGQIIKNCLLANQAGCDLVIFPEMAISGYPCQDLWHKSYFVKNCAEAVMKIVAASKSFECAVIVGTPWLDIDSKKPVLRNSALLIEDGEIRKIIHKKSLPNYGVFDEKRYFEPAQFLSNFKFRGFVFSLLICEDMWDGRNLFLLNEQNIDAVFVINSSPYSYNKLQQRQKIAQKITKNIEKPLIYLNQVGGQDSLVFDGSSFAMNCDGEIILQMSSFVSENKILLFENSGRISQEDFDNNQTKPIGSKKTVSIDESQLKFVNAYQASVLALRDYVLKNNFRKILLGMSGGIDSALVATIAVDALGSENVALYALPTRFNSASSLSDASLCSKNLTIDLKIIDIEAAFAEMLSTARSCGEVISELAQENLQARIRGSLLMTLANSSGALLLSTSNKSELACGYGTLYGDMCGAFNPIKDFYKSEIYKIADWRNQNLCPIAQNQIYSPIPQSILLKEPSAELRYNQKDSDSLPPYEGLDQILFAMIEEQKSIAEIVNSGFENALVSRVAKLFYDSEHKRKQAVIGVKVSEMAFDNDRRYPITNKFKI